MTDFKKTATQKNTKSTEEVRGFKACAFKFEKLPKLLTNPRLRDVLGQEKYTGVMSSYLALFMCGIENSTYEIPRKKTRSWFSNPANRDKFLALLSRLQIIKDDGNTVTLSKEYFDLGEFFKNDKEFDRSDLFRIAKEISQEDFITKQTKSRNPRKSIKSDEDFHNGEISRNEGRENEPCNSGYLNITKKPNGTSPKKYKPCKSRYLNIKKRYLNITNLKSCDIYISQKIDGSVHEIGKKPNDYGHLQDNYQRISDLNHVKDIPLINTYRDTVVVVCETPETAAATPTHDNNNNTLVIETHVQQGKPFTVSSFHEGNTPTAQPLQERRDEGMVGGYSSLTPSAQPLQALPAPSQANALRAQSQKQHHDMGVDIPMGEPHTGGMDDTKPTGMLFPTPKANPAPTTLVAPLPLNGQVKVKDNTAQGGGARAGGAAVEAEIKSLLESVVDSIDFSRLTDNKGNPIHDIDGLLPHAVRLAPRALLYRAEVAVVLVIYWASLPKYRTYGLRGENMDDTNHIRMMLDSERPLSDFVSLIQGYFADDYYLKNPHFRNLHKILGDGVPWNAKNRALARNTPAQGGVVRVTAAQRAAQNEQNHRECPDFEEPEMQAFLLREYCKDIKATPEEFFAMAGSEQGVITRLRTFYGTEVRPMWHIFGKEYSASKNSGQLSPVLRLAVGG
jgi:hypothetical protein